MNEKQIDDEFARMQRVATRVIRWWNIECAKGQQSETPESVYLAQAFLKYGAVRPEEQRTLVIEECRRACIDVGTGAAEAAKAKDATDYIAGYQDAAVDCDEALRELLSLPQNSSHKRLRDQKMSRALDTAKREALTLKWGTLKAWDLKEDGAALALLRKYHALGSCVSAMFQHDTPEQQRLLCQMIDAVDADTICLDWDGKDVSKEEAKRYVMEYRGKK